MPKKNVVTLDRALRIIVGLALIAGFFLSADASLRWLCLLGTVPLMAGKLGSCPPCALPGINTCKTGS